MAKKPTKHDTSDNDSLSNRARDIVERGLAGIGDRIDILRASVKAGNGESASELGLLAHKAAQIMGEARKLQSAEAKQDLSAAQLVEYFRSKCTAEQRAQWAADILAMNRKGSVLG